LTASLGALRAERCARIFREKVSGRDLKARPQLAKAIDFLGMGDVLVLAEWDRPASQGNLNRGDPPRDARHTTTPRRIGTSQVPVVAAPRVSDAWAESEPP
jgi:predicted amidohydrolase